MLFCSIFCSMFCSINTPNTLGDYLLEVSLLGCLELLLLRPGLNNAFFGRAQP
jgi:hypothetical protein